MRFLRGLSGGLLWIVASLLGLVAVLLCVTVILLPVGIPLLMLARRMFGRAVGLMLPRAMSHPVDELSKKTRRKGGKVPDLPDPSKVAKGSKKLSKKAKGAAAETARKATGRKRRRVPVPW